MSLFLCVSLFAQNKIAVVDRNVFYDEKNGITELVIANKKLEAEFEPTQKELQSLNEKLQKIVIEIGNGHSYRGTKLTGSEINKAEEVILEAQNLSNKIKLITDEVIPRIEKRKIEVVEPVKKRIANKLEIFKKNKGYILVIDQDSIGKGIITDNPSAEDITKEFIKFCNEEFEKEISINDKANNSSLLSKIF